MTSWPVLNEQFDDEFGAIAPDVYAAAGQLWPRAERFATRVLNDDAEGMTLMMRAAVVVSRRRAQGAAIQSLSAFLYRTFRNLLWARQKERKRHKELEEANKERLTQVSAPTASNIETQILIEQLRNRMDSWTKEVWDLRMLGHTFQEIGPMLDVEAGTVRDRFRKNIKALAVEGGNRLNNSDR